MIWREKRVILIVLAVLLAANAFFFFTYRVQYESRLEALDARRDQARAQLAEAKNGRARAEQQLAAYRKIDRDVQVVLNERWSTEEQRLTGVIAEIRRLTERAQLTPPASTSYSRGEIRERAGSAGTGATEVGVGFTVSGTYQQIRRFINLLELSNEFIIIDRLGLSAAEGDRLTMNIHIKTLFRDTTAPVRPVSNRQL
jgi:hypothetical protein